MIRKFTLYFLKLLYNDLAWAYDFIASIVSLGNWYNWVKTVIPLIEGRNILEIGHGTGHLQKELHHSSFSTFSIDQSLKMGKIAKKRLNNNHINNSCIVGKAQHIPFPSNHFNSVVATFPTSCIFERDSLKEIKRVLIPGSDLIILLAAWISESSIPGALLAKIYHLTGQAPDPNGKYSEFTAPLRKAGYDPKILFRRVGEDTLLVIHARS
jgi:ubiquinone/menaquinone biosynthesis C-methylase UbiE